MKDSEMRALVLRRLYELRRDGWAGIKTDGVISLSVDGMTEKDVLHIGEQLGEHGLVDWKGIPDHRGNPCAGVGKITAYGVDVVEGEEEPPIPIVFAQTTQNITISGQNSGIQIAGSNSSQQQTIAQEIEKLISAIDGASVSEAEKKEGKSRLAEFLKSSAMAAILGPTASALLKRIGL